VLSITDRKIAHWRDYLDPLAVFDAIGWPTAGGVSTR
jgi:limonene-1,2-epoxide hydrolase